ncbi:hypothetical protein DN069_16980 [Streptacidiphilus pinicola]|uniref:Uncharacterized protein n=1 Tax=Streptacidiphilus pinicola TaxID=2219663 RepID=A0A2X0JA28_9ACTN|nr:hypothetical protein [Streptacidiphilus pinicola]RAG84358.1 hypothetical protein DN069_16980 [Streptacidiphilus pinicola]
MTTPQNPYQTPQQGGQAPQNPYAAPGGAVPPQGYPGQAAPNQGVPPQGYPGQAPQGFPAPPAAGYAAPPAAPKVSVKRRFGFAGARLIVSLVLLVVVGGGYWVYDQMSGGADTAKAGDCMHNDGSDTSPDLHVISCSDSGAQYKVVKAASGDDSSQCNDAQGATKVYTQTGGRGTSDVTLCLAVLGSNG